MKKLLFIILIFLISCSGTKKLEKSNLSSNVTSGTEVSKKLDEKQTGSVTGNSLKTADKKTDSSEKKNKTIETKTTDFDSSKPIVPGTGKPPVLKETTKIVKESNQKDIQIQEGLTEKLNIQLDYTRTLQLKLDSMKKENTSLKSESELKETTISNWWKWLLGGVGIGFILLFLIKQIPFVVIFSKIKAFFTK